MQPSYRYLRVAVSRPLCSILFRLASSHSTHHAIPRHFLVTRLQNRGKKTKASLKLDDLPQGAIPLDPLPLEDEVSYPVVVVQARSHMRKFENCVLLTRVGGFYEFYDDQAEEFGPLLNLKVVNRQFKAGPVPMVSCSLSYNLGLLTENSPDFPSSS